MQGRKPVRMRPDIPYYAGEPKTSIAEPTLNVLQPQNWINKPHFLPSFHSFGNVVHDFSKTIKRIISAKMCTYHFRLRRPEQRRKAARKWSTSTQSQPHWRPSWRTVFLYMQSLSEHSLCLYKCSTRNKQLLPLN